MSRQLLGNHHPKIAQSTCDQVYTFLSEAARARTRAEMAVLETSRSIAPLGGWATAVSLTGAHCSAINSTANAAVPCELKSMSMLRQVMPGNSLGITLRRAQQSGRDRI